MNKILVVVIFLFTSPLLKAQTSNEDRKRMIQEYNDAVDPVKTEFKNRAFTVYSKVYADGKTYNFYKRFDEYQADVIGRNFHVEWTESYGEPSSLNEELRYHYTADVPISKITLAAPYTGSFKPPRGNESNYKKIVYITIGSDKKLISLSMIKYEYDLSTGKKKYLSNKLTDEQYIFLPYTELNCSSCTQETLTEGATDAIEEMFNYFNP